jgi:hypothetical protein
MAWDPDHGRVILHAGYANQGVPPPPPALEDDTWAWDGKSWTEVDTGDSVVTPRQHHGLAWDEATRSLLVYGGDGIVQGPGLGDLALFDGAGPTRPALQLDAALAPIGNDPIALTKLRVRARCGARYSPYGAADVGAELMGWRAGGLAGERVGFEVLDTNAAGSELGVPQGDPTLDWTADSPEEAERFVRHDDPLLVFQCRPKGVTGEIDARAEVSAEGFEVRLRYVAP